MIAVARRKPLPVNAYPQPVVSVARSLQAALHAELADQLPLSRSSTLCGRVDPIAAALGYSPLSLNRRALSVDIAENRNIV
ncbi:hypothetical protein [Nocardia sp. NPDC057353]|uniref:hypothetical protein n=1 Tax=Nocardia sp. NPDC057353 TaxID=3346104 RepID=UPI0036297F24